MGHTAHVRHTPTGGKGGIPGPVNTYYCTSENSSPNPNVQYSSSSTVPRSSMFLDCSSSPPSRRQYVCGRWWTAEYIVRKHCAQNNRTRAWARKVPAVFQPKLAPGSRSGELIPWGLQRPREPRPYRNRPVADTNALSLATNTLSRGRPATALPAPPALRCGTSSSTACCRSRCSR